MSTNRLVVLLTPLIFAPAAGFVTAWVARNVPGLPPLDSTQVTTLFVAGATVALAQTLKWLHGHHLEMQLNARAAETAHGAPQQPATAGLAIEEQSHVAALNGSALSAVRSQS
jgi:hypothetical protein